MHRFLLASLSALALAGCTTIPTHGEVADTRMTLQTLPEPAPLSRLVDQVQIPYERFVLDNGLTTVVHTDRKAPIVGVTLYYRVGSRHEPRGRTGFAHLYEHLFFGGSANVENFDKPLEAAGSTSTNGSTWYDRTNYVETVPTGALDLALFQESDRMGYLLPAVTQGKLDKQRSVVQNEKRQGDNQPYGLMGYAQAEGLLPVGHPYRHATIGSMVDLDAATLSHVRDWFRDNYGPNNVVLVLTGDIDAKTARPLVEKWFGAFPRGPEVPVIDAAPVTLAASKVREMADQVPLIRLTRNWTGPGVNDADGPALEIGLRVLGGLAGSRLDNALVRGDELAVAVTAGAYAFEKVSFLEATMDVKPGMERAVAEAKFDAVIARFLAEGPTPDELQRAVTSTLSSQIGALERVGGFGGKGVTLAEGELFSGDPAKFRKDLAAMAALTPETVKAAMQRWLGRPVFALNVSPGTRTQSGETMGGWGDEATSAASPADPKKPTPTLAPAPRREAPPVADVAALTFPTIEHARLSNGIPVALARRNAIPKVVISIEFGAGFAADSMATPGTQAMMLDMLDEGTATRSATRIAEEQERLGASIRIGGNLDTSSVAMSALTANLAPSLALMADLVRNPAFAPGEVARIREQQLAELSQVLAEPGALAGRELGTAIHAGHPYAQPSDGLGNAAAVAALTPEALRAAHAQWLRPERARITAVGDVTMADLLPLLETAFGDWRSPDGVKLLEKALDAPIAPARSRIILIDRPNSPQSVIAAGRVLSVGGQTPGLEALEMANEVLGGGFLARLNADLREDKGWSYGVYSAVSQPAGPRSFTLSAPVQSDRTGDSIKAILADLRAFPLAKPVSQEELHRVIEGTIRRLPTAFETNSDVLSAIQTNARMGRPDDYYETLAGKLRTLDAPAIEAAARKHLLASDLVFVVVGDRKVVEPQLRRIGLPMEIAAPATGD
ncbi:MAG TPA: pitrilysin family protein [Novosphingobium sp.]|nr:pitrilysin family protein [Novosphingobium sp.]